MARTRTSDQTLNRQYAKPLVYACLLTLGVAGQAVGGQGERVPCVTCQVLSVTPGQVKDLPAALARLRIAVRTTPGAQDWQAAVTGLAQRGAKTGLHLAGTPGDQDPLLGAAVDVLILEPAVVAAGDDLARAAFELKRALAVARGRRPSATLLVSAPPAMAEQLRARGVAPYADGFVDPPVRLASAADLFDPTDPDRTRVRLLPPDPPVAAGIVRAAVATAGWFPNGLVPATDRPLQCGDAGPVRA